jgi:hypothetical protein
VSAYNSNTSYVRPGWLQGGRPLRDFRTGDHMTVAGDVPVICNRGVTAPAGLDLLREAGFDLSRRLEYRDPASYADLLAELSSDGEKAVFQHAHPAEEFPARSYWMDRDLLCFLNNKGNLETLVPEGYAPRREVLAPEGLHVAHPALRRLPVVVKAATDETSGGGRSVRICRTRREVEEAVRYLSVCRAVVVEEYLSMERSLCVQYVAPAADRIEYLGFAEQVTTPEGRFLGSWLEVGDEADAEVVEMGRMIMERAVAMGYRGIAGFDVAVRADGPPLFFDLNFRLNGSTAPVLLFDEAVRVLRAPVLRYRTWRGRGSFAELIETARGLMREGRLLPLSTYDPARAGVADEPPQLSGLAACESRRATDTLLG